MQVWPHGGQKRYEAMERNWCRKGRQRHKRGLCGDVQEYLCKEGEMGGEDTMWHILWGEDADAFAWKMGGELIWCCFFWRYYSLIYRIGVGNTCGDRIGSVLARLNSPLRLCFAYRLYSRRCAKRNRFPWEEVGQRLLWQNRLMQRRKELDYSRGSSRIRCDICRRKYLMETCQFHPIRWVMLLVLLVGNFGLME